jgi:hypothetical protein
MSDLNSIDPPGDPSSSSQQFPSALPHVPVNTAASEANMLTQFGLPANDPFAFMFPQMQQIQMQDFLQNLHMQQNAMLIAQLMAQVSQAPIGAIDMLQQPHLSQTTPRRAYIKRKRETPTPKRQTVPSTPAQASSEPAEAFPEVNFNDHSAYNRLLSSVWDLKGDPPWSRYSVEQVISLHCHYPPNIMTL